MPAFSSIWLKFWLEPRLTWNHMPGACTASELNRVPVLPSIALAGASAPAAAVLVLAVQPFSDNWVSACGAACAVVVIVAVNDAVSSAAAAAATASRAFGVRPRYGRRAVLVMLVSFVSRRQGRAKGPESAGSRWTGRT